MTTTMNANISGFDPHTAIVKATIESLRHYVKINLGVALSQECLDKICEFIKKHDVTGGIRCLVVKDLEDADVSFESTMESADGMSEKKVSLVWKKNEKWGDKSNLLKIKIEKSVKEVFKNFCVRRSIPLAEELAEVLDFERPIRISVYHKLSFYKGMLEKSRKGEFVYVGQTPNANFYFETVAPSAAVNRKENAVMVFNGNAKNFGMYTFAK